MRNRIYITLLFLIFAAPFTYGQETEKEEEKKEESQAQAVQEIFYDTRTVNLHTVMPAGKNVLAYRISHRLGPVYRSGSGDSPLYNFLGLDGPGSISFLFDYGLRDNLTIGVARASVSKVYSSYAKWNFINQQSGGGSPITIALYGKANIISLKDKGAVVNGFDRYEDFSHRMSYISQLMFARKFGERIAVQVSPTFVHHNLVERTGDKNSIFAVAASAQLKFTKRLGISGEYIYVIGDYVANPEDFFSSASFGLDIVTGGHVFQIHLTNSIPINEAFGIPYTRSDWLNGDFRIGFNISRKFWL